MSINNKRPISFIKSVEKIIGKLEKKKIAILGLSFKPETDDLRDSPSIEVVNYLIKLEAKVFSWDPIVKRSNLPKGIQNKVTHSSDLELVCKKKIVC